MDNTPTLRMPWLDDEHRAAIDAITSNVRRDWKDVPQSTVLQKSQS